LNIKRASAARRAFSSARGFDTAEIIPDRRRRIEHAQAGVEHGAQAIVVARSAGLGRERKQ
jgi:hypothetical protein